MSKMEVFYEITPNPNSMKFTFTAPIAHETLFIDDPLKTSRSPLAQKLFGFPWTSAVYIGHDYVTITKQEWVDWKVLAEPLSDLLSEHIENKEPVIIDKSQIVNNDENSDAHHGLGHNDSAAQINETDSPIVKKIKEILNHEIRPAVAMDGGDIVFNRFEDNRLYLHMHGACSGCPSSAITLKDGIESRLKEAIPELIEVIAI